MGLEKPVLGGDTAPKSALGTIAGNGKNSMSITLDFTPSKFAIFLEYPGTPDAYTIIGFVWDGTAFMEWISDANAYPNGKINTYGSVTVSGNTITAKCNSTSFKFQSTCTYRWIASA